VHTCATKVPPAPSPQKLRDTPLPMLRDPETHNLPKYCVRKNGSRQLPTNCSADLLRNKCRVSGMTPQEWSGRASRVAPVHALALPQQAPHPGHCIVPQCLPPSYATLSLRCTNHSQGCGPVLGAKSSLMKRFLSTHLFATQAQTLESLSCVFPPGAGVCRYSEETCERGLSQCNSMLEHGTCSQG
jgi:hypothetical protein